MAALGKLAGGRPHSEIIGIQAMRYIAALSVLLDHYIIRLVEQGSLSSAWLPYAYRMGAIGVYVFFAISGFVMVLTNRDKFQASGSASDFLIRRVIRIWPMYFLATMIVFGVRHADPLYSLENLFKSLTFIPYIGDEGLYRPVLGKGWTLNYEMFFYAVFAVCLFFPKKIGLTLAALCLVALAGAGNLDGGVLWKFYTDKIVLFFLLGMSIAQLTMGTSLRLPRFTSASAAICAGTAGFGLALFSGRVPGPALVKEIALFGSVFLCLYAVCFPVSRFRSERVAQWFATLGDSSYCLYLFHGFAMVALHSVLNRVADVPPVVTVPVVCAVVTAFCLLIHLYLEKPVNRFLLGAYKKRRSPPAQQAQPAAAEDPAVAAAPLEGSAPSPALEKQQSPTLTA